MAVVEGKDHAIQGDRRVLTARAVVREDKANCQHGPSPYDILAPLSEVDIAYPASVVPMPIKLAPLTIRCHHGSN